MILSTVIRMIKRQFARFDALLQQEERNALIARHVRGRWCDSAERALHNELLGKYGWFSRRES
jgi:hypothetical protein